MIEKNNFDQDEVEQFDQLIIKDLGLHDDDSLQLFVGNEELRKRLKMVIAYLLQHDFNRLVNAMYRLDVKESLFHEAMNLEDPEQVIDSLANIVLEREWQKVQTRLFFKRNK